MDSVSLNFGMTPFDECIEYAKTHSGLGFEVKTLKEKQLEVLNSLYKGNDCIAVLPTGYGKSIIFQILPWFFQKKFNQPEPSIVIVVSPLNSLMQDQLLQLRRSNIKACSIDIVGSKAVTFFDEEQCFNEDNEEENDLSDFKTDVPLYQLEKGDFNIIYVHPETFTANKLSKLLRSNTYQEKVCAIVIDEVHIVSEWGEEFRPAFKRLGEATCMFNSAVHLALTATATKSTVADLQSILNYRSPDIICENPDRPNIFIDVRKRLPNIRKFEKYDGLIKPIAQELLQKKENFPLTIMYVESLESLGYFYQYLTSELQDNAFVGEHAPENRIFAQFHKDYPDTMKQFIVREIVKPSSRIRLVFATIALGMGLNAPGIQRIIHCRPPTSMEKYMQENRPCWTKRTAI